MPGFTSGSSRHPRHRPGAPCRTFPLAQGHAGGGSPDGVDVAPPRSANRPRLSVVAGLRRRSSTRAFPGARVGCHWMPRKGQARPAPGRFPLLGQKTRVGTTHCLRLDEDVRWLGGNACSPLRDVGDLRVRGLPDPCRPGHRRGRVQYPGPGPAGDSRMSSWTRPTARPAPATSTARSPRWSPGPWSSPPAPSYEVIRSRPFIAP